MDELLYFVVSELSPLMTQAAGITTGFLLLLWLAISAYKFFFTNMDY